MTNHEVIELTKRAVQDAANVRNHARRGEWVAAFKRAVQVAERFEDIAEAICTDPRESAGVQRECREPYEPTRDELRTLMRRHDWEVDNG